MKNDEITNLIITKALFLFNTKGINVTSIQDIMDATALPKGAIYRRFTNKEAIVLAAFEKGNEMIWNRILQESEQHDTMKDKLLAIPSLYYDAVNNPPIEGGCPLLNAAIESDGSFPELQEKTSEFYTRLLVFLRSLLEQGIRDHELREDVDTKSLASFLISTIEGAIMSSRLCKNNDHILYAVEQFENILPIYSR